MAVYSLSLSENSSYACLSPLVTHSADFDCSCLFENGSSGSVDDAAMTF